MSEEQKKETTETVASVERPWYYEAKRLSVVGLDPLQRAHVLECLAHVIWVAGEEGSGEREYHCKSYDPLTIELSPDGSGVAHSYVFNFHDGGRHHPFDSLDEVEDWLIEAAIGVVKWAGQWAVEEAQLSADTQDTATAVATQKDHS